ncbi:MAG: FtsX-like permease family protein [Actinomycetota bacterium]
MPLLALSSTSLAAIVVVALVSAPFVVGLLIHPITRRLAFRYPRRRVTETLLVVVGSLLGTSIITGSLIVGDTIDRSIRSIAYEQLGPIDELIAVSGLEEGSALVARLDSLDVVSAVDADGEPIFDGILTMTGTPVAVSGVRSQPRAQLLEVDFAAGAAFGDDPGITGLDGTTPRPGEAVVTTDLATRTDVAVGDVITVYAYGQPAQLDVVGVLERDGVAGFWPIDSRQQAYNLFVTPGTLEAGLRGVELPPEVEPPQTYVALSNVGGVEDGALRTDDALAVLADLDPALPVQPVKRDALDAAEEGAAALTQLYVTMGMFAVAAGILLLVNLFVMLSDERRSQLGMLRALGMRRASLVTAFATEGWLYAVVSSALGAVVGIQLGRVIAWRADDILTTDDDIFSLDLTFAYDLETVALGFAIGLAISVVTIVLTSIRISRLNVIAAIRDLPVVTGRSRRDRRRVVAGTISTALGVLWTAAAFAGGEQYGIAMGPMLVVVALGALAAGRVGARTAVTSSSLVVLAWGTAFLPLLAALDVEGDIQTFLVQGLTMCAAGVALLMVHHKALGAWLSERSGGSLPVRVGLAYPVARGFRTAMSLGMFAIVVLTIVYLSFISLMFGNQASRITADISGGYGLVVTSNPSSPVTVHELAGFDGVEAVAPLAYSYATFELGDRDGTWPLTGFGPELVEGPPHLVDLGGYETEAAAWAAVAHDPDLVIVDEFFLSSGGPVEDVPFPGDQLTIRDPASASERTVTVAAIATPDFIAAGAYYGIDGYRDLFGARTVASRYYVAADDLVAAADAIGVAHVANGAEAQPVRVTVDTLLAQNEGFFTLMQQFVGVGLLVGIAGLGVVMVRSVRERRREVGVLRAIGLEPQRVTGSFLFEATFIATEGVLIGVLVAFVGTYGLVLNNSGFMEGFSWAVPWTDVLIVSALTLTAAALTAAVPSRQAGRIRPAQALRTLD